MSRAARVIAGVATIVVFAAIGLAARAALDSGGGAHVPSPPQRPAAGSPPAPVAASRSFSAGDAVGDSGASLVAHAKARSVLAYAKPDRRGRAVRVHALRVEGKAAPLVFLVESRRPGWVQVSVGRRPNGSRAWVRSSDVDLTSTRYRIEVQRRRHRLTVWRGQHVVLRSPIAVGKALSPTPKGRYFIADLIKPRDSHGFYGPYAFGLSAYSSVYTSFAGGDGQVGIHGTSSPGAIGRDVSHGCIRVRNAVIKRLAERIPLGSPVEITS